jgi:hypothetical protein
MRRGARLSMDVFQTNIRTASTCSGVMPALVILVFGSIFLESMIQRWVHS